MNVPDGPFYCDVCKKDSIYRTQEGDEKKGMFTLPITVDGVKFQIRPQTALCQYCGQIKFFIQYGE